MRIVGGKGGEAPAFVQELVEQIPAIAPVAFDGAAMVVDFDRMGAVDGAAILDGELRPGGMRDADEGAASAARGQLGAGFALARRAENRAAGRRPRYARVRRPAFPGACSSEPMMVVKLLERSARVSAIGQL